MAPTPGDRQTVWNRLPRAEAGKIQPEQVQGTLGQLHKEARERDRALKFLRFGLQHG